MTCGSSLVLGIHLPVALHDDTSDGMHRRAGEAERPVDLARRMGVDPDEAMRLVQRLSEAARLGAVDEATTERVLSASAPHGPRTCAVAKTSLSAWARRVCVPLRLGRRLRQGQIASLSQSSWTEIIPAD